MYPKMLAYKKNDKHKKNRVRMFREYIATQI